VQRIPFYAVKGGVEIVAVVGERYPIQRDTSPARKLIVTGRQVEARPRRLRQAAWFELDLVVRNPLDPRQARALARAGVVTEFAFDEWNTAEIDIYCLALAGDDWCDIAASGPDSVDTQAYEIARWVMARMAAHGWSDSMEPVQAIVRALRDGLPIAAPTGDAKGIAFQNSRPYPTVIVYCTEDLHITDEGDLPELPAGPGRRVVWHIDRAARTVTLTVRETEPTPAMGDVGIIDRADDRDDSPVFVVSGVDHEGAPDFCSGRSGSRPGSSGMPPGSMPHPPS
jgi:hypothetical protein